MKTLSSEELRAMLEEVEEVRVADGFDDCIVGLCEEFGRQERVVYSREAIIDSLARDMPREEAEEYYYYNILGAYLGEGMPIFIH